MAVYKCVSFVCALLLLFSACHGFGTGAPPVACESMHPGHLFNASAPVVPQTSTSPYSIVVEGDEYTPGAYFRVQIEGPEFRGFLLQARKPGATTPIGSFAQFDAPTDTKTITCTTPDSSMTHSDTTVKRNITLTWNPPSPGVGKVHFIATVAETRVTYWMNVMSEEVAEGVTDGASLAKPTCYLLVLCLLHVAIFLK